MRAFTPFAFSAALLVSASLAQEPGTPLPETRPQQTAATDQASGKPAPIERVTPRVARLNFFSGAVQAQRADNTGEDTPLINMPLRQGTRIVTGDYGQAEVEFEDGSLVRITPRSSLSLDTLSLDAKKVAHTRLALLSGLAYFELRKAPALDFQVDAGGVEASPLENVTLRVNLDEQPAVFAVLAGAAQLQHTAAPAEASTADAPPPASFKTSLRAGETLRLDPADDSRYFLTASVAQESWDQWNQDRDQAAANLADTRTAARDGFAGAQGYGWSDLDADGTWYNVPGKGEVWQPNDATPADPADASSDNPVASFDPYSNGAWVWSGQGYAFASAYPWGWTPYRCGSWAFYPGFGWAWAPDSSCSQFGYGGFDSGLVDYVVIYEAAGRPPRQIPIPRPKPGPGAPGPIIPVHRPTGIHPPRPHPRETEVRIAGQMATPLPMVGSSLTHREAPIGSALILDYPVDAKSHQPILGTTPGSVVAAKPTLAGAPGSAPASSAHHPRPAETSTQARPTNSTPAYRPAPPAPAPPATRSAPPPPPAPAPAPAPASTAKPK